MNQDDPVKKTLEILNETRASANPSEVHQVEPGPVPNFDVKPRPAPWNKSEVIERLGEDEDLLREMCAIFLTESAIHLEQLRLAMKTGDTKAMQRAAHSLKGEVGYLAAAGAMRAARLLEDMGRDGDLTRAPEMLGALEREMEWLYNSIREFVDPQT